MNDKNGWTLGWGYARKKKVIDDWSIIKALVSLNKQAMSSQCTDERIIIAVVDQLEW